MMEGTKVKITNKHDNKPDKENLIKIKNTQLINLEFCKQKNQGGKFLDIKTKQSQINC